MRIKKLFSSLHLPYHWVLQMPDGRYMQFRAAPYRRITESDLEPIPCYQAKGEKANEAPEYIYRAYGLEKEAN